MQSCPEQAGCGECDREVAEPRDESLFRVIHNGGTAEGAKYDQRSAQFQARSKKFFLFNTVFYSLASS
jgi:hypothetical protein